MAEHRLRHAVCAVDNNGLLTYGGSQLLSDSAVIKKCGCGVVAAADLFIYAHRFRVGCHCDMFDRLGRVLGVPLNEYNSVLRALSRRYFPLTPPFGINGLGLVCGMNLYFMTHSWSLRAQWGVRYRELWQSIESMLDDDIPVIIAVGPNMPRFWQDNRLGLYTRLPDGNYKRIGAVKAHYMTVTAIDDDYLTVSSWGRKYYISRCEYDAYTRAYSNGLLCNIVYIK